MQSNTVRQGGQSTNVPWSIVAELCLKANCCAYSSGDGDDDADAIYIHPGDLPFKLFTIWKSWWLCSVNRFTSLRGTIGVNFEVTNKTEDGFVSTAATFRNNKNVHYQQLTLGQLFIPERRRSISS
ncbi:hypothetical protein DINM_005063 [Dirofilaria immitis]|nr:hypothetical protein [Dirofilaria immitis]